MSQDGCSFRFFKMTPAKVFVVFRDTVAAEVGKMDDENNEAEGDEEKFGFDGKERCEDGGGRGSEGKAIGVRFVGLGSSAEAAANTVTGFCGRDGCLIEDEPDGDDCSSWRNLASIFAILSSVLNASMSIDP